MILIMRKIRQGRRDGKPGMGGLGDNRMVSKSRIEKEHLGKT